MLRELRGLARETAVYGLSTVLGRLLSFLLTPLYSHLLEPADNGAMQAVYAYVAFLTVVYGLGLDTAFLRLGRREGRSDDGAFSAAWLAVVGTAAAASALIHFAAAPLAAAIGLPVEAAQYVRYAAWILAVDAAMLLPYAELRGSHRAGAYAGVKLAGIAMNIALAYVFVKVMGLGLRGVFLANLVASCSALAMLSPVILSRLASADRARLREMLGFGLPLVVAGIGSMVVQVADRPILARVSGLAEAGVYGTCYKLGIGMMLLVGMFDQAWKPFILERADRPDAGAIVARVLTYFATLGCWAFLAIAFLVGPLATAPLFGGHALIHPSFWGGLSVVPVVTLGYLFNGLYFVMLAPLMLDKRTGAVSAATWAGAAANLALNWALIPRLGMMGAAWATLAAYAAMAVAVWALGRSSRPAPYEWRRLLILAGWTAALWWCGSGAPLAARAIVLAAYPVGLLLSGFLGADELSELKGLLSARRAGR
ncbi:MAG: lipopolysaccharide biosynthesis protein [Elusimicrobiota bacterium]|nr:MAG: lipopolysaccharide biosynthesis protein [Elusimicrobiota bacterium]